MHELWLYSSLMELCLLDRLLQYIDSFCISNLRVMRSATPHRGVEPCVGPKTIVMRFPTGMGYGFSYGIQDSTDSQGR